MEPRLGPALVALQQRLGHRFAQPELLQRALTHRSWGAEHNERLEFLGDAVLSLAVSGLLYQRHAGSDEGDLTRVRAHLVREDSLHRVALALGLPEVLRMSEGELRGGGAQRPSLLADGVEALIGAVFLDGGYEPAHALVQRFFGEVIEATEAENWSKDAKTELQEWLQGRKMKLPIYRVVGTLGVAHKQTFDVECEITEFNMTERGIGGSRRAGEQAAAAVMLQTLKAKAR